MNRYNDWSITSFTKRKNYLAVKEPALRWTPLFWRTSISIDYNLLMSRDREVQIRQIPNPVKRAEAQQDRTLYDC